MSKKSPKSAYGEFRMCVEWVRGNRRRLKPEAVPSFAAFLLMIGRRYQATADGLANEVTQKTVPGAPELLARAEIARDVCAALLRILPETFSATAWYEAVADTCAVMGIVPFQEPPDDVPAEQFSLFAQELERVSNSESSERPFYASAGDGASGSESGPRPALPDERVSDAPLGPDSGASGSAVRVPRRKKRGPKSASGA